MATVTVKGTAAVLSGLLTSVIVHVKGCDGIINKSTSHATVMTDAFVMVYDENNKQVLQTSVVENSVKPTWDEANGAIGVDLTGHGNLTFQVWHRGRKHQKEGDAFLGECVAPAHQFIARKKGELTLPLAARIKEPDPRVKMLDATPGALGSLLLAWHHGSLTESQLGEMTVVAEGRAFAELTVVGCRGLLKRDFGEYALSDPYVVVRYPGTVLRFRSEVAEMTLNPTFKASPMTIHLPPEGMDSALRVRVWNANPKPEKDSFLGEAVVDVKKLRSGEHNLPLEPRINETDTQIAKLKGRLGTVLVKWRVLDPADEPRAEAPPLAPPLPPSLAASQAFLAASAAQHHRAADFDPATYSSQRKVAADASKPTAAPPQSAAPQPQPQPRLPDTAAALPVTLSDVIPVTIVNDSGRELTTSIPFDAPLRSIQAQITDYFTLCPSSQVLTYNRDPIDVNLSLQQNGALLLRGEPSVKLMLHAAKGPIVALTCVLPNGAEVPVSVPESALIAEVKRLLCEAEGVRLRPDEIRLLWRYNELSDKASVEYYRLTHKARIDVVRKPQFDFTHGGKPTESGSDAHTKRRSARAVPKQDGPPQLARAAAQAAAAAAVVRTLSPQGRRIIAGSSSAPVRPQSATATLKAARSQQQPRAQSAVEAVPPRVPSKVMVSVPPRPKAFYESSMDEEQDADLVRLRQTLDALRQNPSAAPSAASNTLRPSTAERATVETLRSRLEESERRRDEALERVAELEQTVERYQLLLRRLLRK